MKYFKKTSYLILLIALSFLVGCTSDDDSNPSNPRGSQLEFAGDPHTYNFTITGGEIAGDYIGEIENDLTVTELLLANYSAYMQFGNEKDISLNIFKENLIIGGSFNYANGTIGSLDNNASNLSFQFEPSAIRYNSVSGSMQLSEVDFTDSLGINTAYTGLAAYEISFNGTFINALNGSEVQIEGPIKVNFPENVEQY
ncbi:hypothetical protein [Psychroflexus halocasei]|uniref:Uncharacterized protein n=1 Tax=Psychroflexus halocasei TaxID=908615 RepID=A0A1H4AGS4_9FLAO|nr:hypothetical protein [Psychroflexus halocasei]SEA35076.1 hypothetical protein SAMN05421540_10529 [Psychroflexus halocasei]